MEIRQLLYLVTVAEEASFTRAAWRLRVAQPGISAQIKLLEQELGQKLFDRSGRTVKLTEVGRAVVPSARAALAAVESARTTVDEMVGLLRGRVAVGTLVACSLPNLSRLLADFNRAHPDVEITLSEANSDELVSKVLDGRLDLALVGLSGPPIAELETVALIDEALVAAVPKGNAWSSRASITLEALCERRLISLPRGTGLRTCLDDACLRSGLEPRIAFEAASPLVLADLAERGLGVAVLPSSVVATRRALAAVAIVRPKLRSRVELAWRAGGPRSPAAQRFIEKARGALAPRS